MNRLFLKIPALVIICLFIFSACKKTHPLNEYPTNNRVMNITKKTTVGASVITDNYRFIYDRYNRINEIYFTTNDPLQANTISNLIYRNDTIYDTTRLINNQVIEVDTFITDRRGFIVTTYIQGVKTSYSYYLDLLTRIDYAPFTFVNFTSYNGNITQSISSVTNIATENYRYYTDMKNRAGDYWHLNSIMRYGNNLYNNSNLVDSLTQEYTRTKVTYDIDADSKITRTTAKIIDTFGTLVTEVYDLQYEKF